MDVVIIGVKSVIKNPLPMTRIHTVKILGIFGISVSDPLEIQTQQHELDEVRGDIDRR